MLQQGVATFKVTTVRYVDIDLEFCLKVSDFLRQKTIVIWHVVLKQSVAIPKRNEMKFYCCCEFQLTRKNSSLLHIMNK